MSTRDDLIEATRDLLWDRGYAATSPRAILDAAGSGQGSMYHHFRGKEALAQAAIERNAEQMRAQVSADLGRGDTAFERVQTHLLREREVLRGCRFGRLVQDADVVDSAPLRDQVRSVLSWVRDQLTATIARGVADGEFREDLDAARTATAILATLQGAYVLARAEQDTAVFDDAITGALALLTAARAR